MSIANAAHHSMMGGGEHKPYLTKLEYIESSGTQCINPDCIFGSLSEFTLDFLPIQSSSANGGRYIGENLYDSSAYVALYCSYGSSGISYLYNNSESGVYIGSITFGSRQQFSMDAKSKNGYLAVGTTVKNITLPSFTVVDSSPNFSICARTLSDGRHSNYARARLFGFQFREDGVLVRDLIPVLDRDGNAKMFDRVTQTYPTHYGTFIAGLEI